MKIQAVTNPDPTFLKAAYPHPDIELVADERHIKPDTHYITFNGLWRVWYMTPDRFRIPQRRFKTLNSAIFMIKR